MRRSCSLVSFFFFKQKTAYEMRISDWSSDVCSSDLEAGREGRRHGPRAARRPAGPRAEARAAEGGARQGPDDRAGVRCTPVFETQDGLAPDGDRKGGV